jgi:hypothetical protein
MHLSSVRKHISQVRQKRSTHCMYFRNTPHWSDLRKVTARFVVSGNDRCVGKRVGGGEC